MKPSQWRKCWNHVPAKSPSAALGMMVMKIFIDRNYVADRNSRYIVHLHKHCTPWGHNSLHLGHDFTYHKLTRVFGRWYILVLARRKMREKRKTLPWDVEAVGMRCQVSCQKVVHHISSYAFWVAYASSTASYVPRNTPQGCVLPIVRRAGVLHQGIGCSTFI